MCSSVHDLIYIVIAITRKASAMSCTQGNKQPVVSFHVPVKDGGRKMAVHSIKAASFVCQPSGTIAPAIVCKPVGTVLSFSSLSYSNNLFKPHVSLKPDSSYSPRF
jgi:hypothetical protein